MTHALKTWPEYFEQVRQGAKNFEVRKDDRPFESGHRIILQEFDPTTQKYSGRELEFLIGYVLRNYPAIKKGFCVMSLIPKPDYE